MARFLSYLDNPLRWDQTESQNSFALSGLQEIQGATKGRGVLYYWAQRMGRSASYNIQFYQVLNSRAEFQLDEPGQISLGLDEQALFPPSGMISMSDEGFIIAPSLCVKTKKKEVVLMLLHPPNAPPKVSAERTTLSIPGSDDTVTISTESNEIRCLGNISGPFKTAHLVLNRNPHLPVYKDGFNQPIGEIKVPGEINATWKPVARNFEEHLLVFDALKIDQRIVDDLLDKFRWSKNIEDDEPGDYVLGDGIGVNYILRLVLDRGLGRHLADEARIAVD